MEANQIRKPINILVTAPGKVILHGEHSVVYGRLALAASLGLRTSVALLESNDGKIDISLPNLKFRYEYNLQQLKDLLFESFLPTTHALKDFSWEDPDWLHHDSLVDRVQRLLTYTTPLPLTSFQKDALRVVFYLIAGILGPVNIELKPFVLNVTSELQVGAGTGSSASVAVAVAGALVQYVKEHQLQENVSKPEYKPSFWPMDRSCFNEKELELICNWAFCAEKIVHGTPSGIDNTICTYGAMVEFRKGVGSKMLPISIPLKMLLINTNIPRETKHLVLKVAKLHDKYPDLVNNILNAMEDVAFIALQDIVKLSEALTGIPHCEKEVIDKLYEELGMLSAMNHNLLSSLGVSHQKLDEAIQILAAHGLKGKLTGAGGGGYAISLIPPHLEQVVIENVTKTLTSQGFGVIVTTLGGPGVKNECEENY